MSEVLVSGILDFWFGPLNAEGMPEKKEKQAGWFKKDPEFDQRIQKQYGNLMEMAPMGAYDRFANTPEGRTALIILLDQFPRNLFRSKPRAFYTDEKAVVQAREATLKGEHLSLPLSYAYFVLMPFMHSESAEMQDLGLKHFKVLEAKASGAGKEMMKGAVDYMNQHRDIIVQFGRFPHRNEILGRESTP
ncbi:MAG: DUF924 domain-containing protein, partial [Proteobacteria bacterium]